MILCVTGPMAAGKNAASDILEKKGFAHVDADLLAHKAVEECREKILETFGKLAEEKNIKLLTDDGKVNRRNLGALIFTDAELVKKQENIVYPKIDELFQQFMEEHKGQNIVINATVLYKMPLITKVDSVLYVDCPAFFRLFRAKSRDKMPFKQILQRFRQQKNLFAKYKKSNADTRRVWNTGTLASLEKKLDRFLERYREGI